MGLVNLNLSNVAVNIAEDIRNSDTATAVSVTTTASLIAANPNRVAYSIYNPSNVTVFVRESSTVTATLYKHPIPPGYMLESDFSTSRYTGPIALIVASGTANVMVTESTIAAAA
jgi:hypothetical protein